jgi:hypothetical protein
MTPNPFKDQDRLDEIITILGWFAAEDARPEGDHIARRHQPAFPLAEYTTCELCNQPLHRAPDSPTGWGITIWRT